MMELGLNKIVFGASPPPESSKVTDLNRLCDIDHRLDLSPRSFWDLRLLKWAFREKVPREIASRIKTLNHRKRSFLFSYEISPLV